MPVVAHGFKGVDWTSIINTLTTASSNMVSSYLGGGKPQQPVFVQPPSAPLPKWVLPAAIVGGVAVLGGVVLMVLKKKR